MPSFTLRSPGTHRREKFLEYVGRATERIFVVGAPVDDGLLRAGHGDDFSDGRGVGVHAPHLVPEVASLRDQERQSRRHFGETSYDTCGFKAAASARLIRYVFFVSPHRRLFP